MGLGTWLGTASQGSGGTRDAFQQYEQYVGSLAPKFDREIAAVRQYDQNPYLKGLVGSFDNLSAGIDQRFAEVRGGIGSLYGSLDNLPAQLRGSAISSTAGAQMSALQAARTASGGRGGLAFGGGGAALAGRFGGEAAVGQQAALANALTQGSMGRAQFQSGLQGQLASMAQAQTGAQLGLGQALSQGYGQQAGIFESRQGRDYDLRRQWLQSVSGLAGGALVEGLHGQRALADRRQAQAQAIGNSI